MSVLTCTRCNLTKERDEFSGSKRNLSGKASWCKACYLEVSKATREARKLDGVCAACGKLPPIEGRTMCIPCIIRHKATSGLGDHTLAAPLTQKFAEQRGVCPYSGRDLAIGNNASIDHVLPKSTHPELATCIDNLVWADYHANNAKGTLSMDEFKLLITDLYLTLCIDSEEL